MLHLKVCCRQLLYCSGQRSSRQPWPWLAYWLPFNLTTYWFNHSNLHIGSQCVLVTIQTARHSRIYFDELHLNLHLNSGDVQFVSNIQPFSAAWCTKCVLPSCLSIFIRLFWRSNPTHQITRYCKSSGSYHFPNLISVECSQTQR